MIIDTKIKRIPKHLSGELKISESIDKDIQATTANIGSFFQCYITPLKKPLGFKVRSVLESSHHWLSNGH